MSNAATCGRWLAPALVTLLLFSACTEESPIDCVRYDVGAIEGRVLAAGEGIAIEVAARAVEGQNRGRIIAATESDSLGWYRLELPTGLYRLLVDPGSIHGISNDMRDTVRVRPRVHRHDLLRGRAEIRLLMPAELEGRIFALRVETSSYDRDSTSDTAEDGQARFVFPALNPGSYVMELQYSGSDGGVYLPGTFDQAAADTLFVGTEEVAAYTVDFTGSYVSISGRVTGSWQEAQRGGMEVCACDTTMDVVARGYCATDGSFTLDLLVPQPVRLLMVHGGVEQWYEGDTFESARLFDLQPGDRITDVSLVESGIEIWLEGPGDLTVHRATVMVRDETGHDIELTSPQDNPIRVCNLRPGRYFLHLDGHCDEQPWPTQWYAGAESWPDAAPIDLGVGELSRLTLELAEGGRIAGDLFTFSGERPTRADCKLFDLDGEPLCSRSQRCDEGFFEFRGLPDGEYYLAAVLSYGSGDWWYPGTHDIADAVTIAIVDHAAVTGLAWSLPEAEKVRP